MDQLDELFSFLDSNGDGMISYEEFYKAIEKVEINYFQLLKRLRRDFVRAKCNVPVELQGRSFGRDVVSVGDFKEMFSQFKVEIKPFELDALFKEYGQSNGILYKKFLNELLYNKYDIELIKKKVIDYSVSENISLLQLFDFYSRTPNTLVLPEFHQLITSCGLNIPKDEVLEAFSAFDINNNGIIHKEEFIQILQGQMRHQANIGYNTMLQNALDFVPISSMENSIMMSVNPFESTANRRSTFPTQQTFEDNAAYQLTHASNSRGSAAPLGGSPSYGQQFQQQQGNINSIQEEQVLDMNINVEEIIEVILSESKKKKIDLFYLFVLEDKQVSFSYEKDEMFEIVFSALGIKAKGTHYDRLYKNFYIQEKKACGYTNILKQALGLRQFVAQSMIHYMRFNNLNINEFFQRLLAKQGRSLTEEILSYFVTNVLNIIFPKNNTIEIHALFETFEVDDKYKLVGVEQLAKFLSISMNYDSGFDKFDQIDVKNTGKNLFKLQHACAQLKLSPTDLFSQFDTENKYLMTRQNLEEMLDTINVQLSRKEVSAIMQQYQFEERIPFLRIVSQIEDIRDIFKKVCIKAMSCNSMSFEEFFSHFSFDGKLSKWMPLQLITLFNAFNFYPLDKDIYPVYQAICQQRSDIYPSDLAAYIGVQSNATGQQNQAKQKGISDSIANSLRQIKQNPQVFNQQQQQFGGIPFSKNDPIQTQTPQQRPSIFVQQNPFDFNQGNSRNEIGGRPDYITQTESVPYLQGPSSNNIGERLRLKRIVDQQLEILSNALNRYGGTEIVNQKYRGSIALAELEQILIQKYGFTASSDLKEFIASFAEEQNNLRASVQDIFNKANYDHEQFLSRNQQRNGQNNNNNNSNNNIAGGSSGNINPATGQRNNPIQQETMNNNNVMSQVPDERKIQEMRSVLLSIHGNDFVAVSEAFFARTPLLDLRKFVEVAKGIFQKQAGPARHNLNPNEVELGWMFAAIDANKNQSVSYNEFEMYFVDDPEQIAKRKQKRFFFTPQMEQDIADLFAQVDKNGDKQISIDEINRLFSKIGSHVSETEIDEYVRRYDKNSDRKINFEEFKEIMEEKIKNEMLTSESVIDDLKREFKRVDLNNMRSLSMVQLQQVFKNLGVKINPSEFSALFTEIDVSGNRQVDIDELIAFIARNSQVSPLAQSAIMNIRQSRKSSIRDLLNTFKQLPQNYRLSFIRSFHQKRYNLPSSTLKPNLTAGMIYSDLKYEPTDKIDVNTSVLDHKHNPSQFIAEITLKSGVGIPLPDEAAFSRNLITQREAYVSFFDSAKKVPVGNSCKITASWTADLEDKWQFEQKGLDQTMIVRFVGYDAAVHEHLNLCIELVMHYLPEKSNLKTDLEISVSHVIIPISSLNKTGENTLHLTGGDPSKPAEIDPSDVRAKRTGLTGFMKTAFSSKKIESSIIFNVALKIDSKIMTNELSIMPDSLIVRKNALPFCAVYREYFGFKSIQKNFIDQTLASDLIFKTFLKIIDCYETNVAISEFWRTEVMQKFHSLRELKEVFVSSMDHLQQLFNFEKFNFSLNDPTASVYCFTYAKERQRLLNSCLEDLRVNLTLKNGTATHLKATDTSIPFSIEDHLELGEEDNDKMFEAHLMRKSKSVSFMKK